MILAILAFGIVAILGLTMALTISTKSENPPWWTAIAHGLTAVFGVVLVMLLVIQDNQVFVLRFALVFLLAAALAGLGLFSVHIRGNQIATRYVVIHAALGVFGVGLLIISAFTAGL